MSRTATNASLNSSPGTSLSFLSVLVITAGVASIAVAVVNQVLVTEYAWLVMVALTLLLAPLGAIKIPGVNSHVALGEMISFTCAVLFGPSAGVIAAAADGVAISLRVTRTASKFSYNVASNAISMALAVVVTKTAFPSFGIAGAPMPAGQLAAALGLLALCYFLTSTLVITLYLSIWKGMPFLKLWQDNALWTSVSYIVCAAAALAGSLLIGRAGYYVFVIFAATIALVSLFYRNYFERVDQATKRAEKADELNFRTIETLVATLGAVGYAVKSNVRRVEKLAVELGKRAGCSAEEIKALRIASLLHDVGNLALPPFILEKPGELTPDEFEKVRIHSEMSARIAESIGFDSTVATVIRHHHERYDGTGYPSGLKGAEIPLPSRVLGIVDSFNALTSDRPYRQRVSRRQALETLQASAKAFDPEILAKFVELVDSVDEEACRAQSEAIAVVDLQAELASRRRAWLAA